jgi:hypothetical protein
MRTTARSPDRLPRPALLQRNWIVCVRRVPCEPIFPSFLDGPTVMRPGSSPHSSRPVVRFLGATAEVPSVVAPGLLDPSSGTGSPDATPGCRTASPVFGRILVGARIRYDLTGGVLEIERASLDAVAYDRRQERLESCLLLHDAGRRAAELARARQRGDGQLAAAH